MLFVLEYSGSYCMYVQIVRVESRADAQAMADKFISDNPDQWYSATVKELDEGQTGVVFEAGYTE